MKEHFDICWLWWKSIYQALKVTHWKTDLLLFCELSVLKTLWVQIHKRECFSFTNWFFLKALISLIVIEIAQRKECSFSDKLYFLTWKLWSSFHFQCDTQKNDSPRSSQYVFPPSKERSGGVNVHCYLLFITCTSSGYKRGRAVELCSGK